MYNISHVYPHCSSFLSVAVKKSPDKKQGRAEESLIWFSVPDRRSPSRQGRPGSRRVRLARQSGADLTSFAHKKHTEEIGCGARLYTPKACPQWHRHKAKLHLLRIPQASKQHQMKTTCSNTGAHGHLSYSNHNIYVAQWLVYKLGTVRCWK